jgi:hypothetical protein
MVGVETGERLCFRCPSAATDSIAPAAAAPSAGDAGSKNKSGKAAPPAKASMVLNAAASTTSSTIAPAPTCDVGNMSFNNTSVTSMNFGGSTLGAGTTPMAACSQPFCLYGRRLFASDGTTYLGTVTVAAPTLIKIDFDFSSQCTAQHIANLVKCLHMSVGRGVPPGVSPTRRVEVLLCTSESYETPATSTEDGFTSFVSSVVSLDSAEGAAPGDEAA